MCGARVERPAGGVATATRLNDSTPLAWRPRRCQQLQSESAAKPVVAPFGQPPPLAGWPSLVAMVYRFSVRLCRGRPVRAAEDVYRRSAADARRGRLVTPRGRVDVPEADQWMSLASCIRINVK